MTSTCVKEGSTSLSRAFAVILLFLSALACSDAGTEDLLTVSPPSPAATALSAPPAWTPAPMAIATPAPTSFPKPEPVAILALSVAETPPDVPDYDRDHWGGWVDEDGDCQDTRQEVLKGESLVDVGFRSADGCRVETGEWLARFTGSVVTEPGDLDIDHMVPLANAHRSGGWRWPRERKRAYANFLVEPAHLIAVTAGANRSKGSRGPEEWRPPDAGYWCRYALDWITIKQRWELSATWAEFTALGDMLATCDNDVQLQERR